MTEKVKKPDRDDSWWAGQRRAYVEKNDYIFEQFEDWEWVSPFDFYRTLFPEGFLQKKGDETPWDEPGGGHPNGIIVQITNRKQLVKTKTGLEHETPIVERFTLTDDLDQVEERISDSLAKNEAVFCAPVSYFGKSRTAQNARFLHAFAVDLDGVGVQELQNLLKQIKNGRNPKLEKEKWTSVPQPTFIVNSGTGFHLYYVLEKPIPLLPKIVPFLQELKATLTDYIWRDTVSNLEEVQHQGIFQAFRMPGTPTKLNGKTEKSKVKDKYDAVAFVHNGEDGKPWRCSIDYLLDFAGVRGGKKRDELVELMRTGGRTPLERAKKQWPKWYQKRIIDGKPAGRWTNKRALYDWWLRQIKEKATDHHRYWCLNVLAAYAKKCGVSYEELEADALALVPLLEELTTSEDNHFTVEDALAAIDAYYDPIIHKLTRERIERRTAIQIPKNKRNGRSLEKHIENVNNDRKKHRDDGEDEYANSGRPNKAELIRNYAAAHPAANHSEIARALGVSRPTVIKWLKQEPETSTADVVAEFNTVLDDFWADKDEFGFPHPTHNEVEKIDGYVDELPPGVGGEQFLDRYEAERKAFKNGKNGK